MLRRILGWLTVLAGGALPTALGLYAATTWWGWSASPIGLGRGPRDGDRPAAYILLAGGRAKLCTDLDFGPAPGLPGESPEPYHFDLRTVLPPSKAETVHRGVPGLLSWDRTTLLPDRAEALDVAGAGFELHRTRWADGSDSWAVEVSLLYAALVSLVAFAWLLRRSRRKESADARSSPRAEESAS